MLSIASSADAGGKKKGKRAPQPHKCAGVLKTKELLADIGNGTNMSSSSTSKAASVNVTGGAEGANAHNGCSSRSLDAHALLLKQPNGPAMGMAQQQQQEMVHLMPQLLQGAGSAVMRSTGPVGWSGHSDSGPHSAPQMHSAIARLSQQQQVE